MAFLKYIKSIIQGRKNHDYLAELENNLTYRFNNPKLLEQAITHSSLIEQQPSHEFSYERLEYLGDAVLELVITDYLYHNFPEDTEGQLTRKRAAIVNKTSLAAVSEMLSLPDYIRSQTVPANPIEKSESVLSDVFEAIVGSIYIDSDLATVQAVILNLMDLKRLEHEHEFPLRNYKGELIEFCHTNNLPLPQFQTIERTGPDHSRHYKIAVLINGETYGVGEGSSKKKAGKQAAHLALMKLEKNLDVV